MNNRQILSIVVLACFLAPCTVAQSDRDQIRAIREQWVKHWSSNNFDALGTLYFEEAALLPPSGERLTGHTAIANFFKQAKTSQSQSDVKLQPATTEASGNIGFDSGQYSMTAGGGGVAISGGVKISGGVMISGGGGRQQRGNYLVVLKRSGGKWLVIEHAFTEVPPAPTTPPPAQ